MRVGHLTLPCKEAEFYIKAFLRLLQDENLGEIIHCVMAAEAIASKPGELHYGPDVTGYKHVVLQYKRKIVELIYQFLISPLPDLGMDTHRWATGLHMEISAPLAFLAAMMDKSFGIQGFLKPIFGSKRFCPKLFDMIRESSDRRNCHQCGAALESSAPYPLTHQLSRSAVATFRFPCWNFIRPKAAAVARPLTHGWVH